MSFSGKVILITGAASGIGAQTVRDLAKLGAKVSIVDRNEKGLHEVADEIKKSGLPTPLPIVADITKDTARIVDETIKHFGQLDVLVNNAGIGVADNFFTLEMSKFNNVIDVNVCSIISLTKLCVPHLQKTKGNIVNIASVAGLKPIRNMFSYGISKAALNHFTKCCAMDLASLGIRVNAINPGVIRTPIYDGLGLTPVQVEKMLSISKSKHIIVRLGEVSDISAAIAYLANDKAASFLTGVLLPVDGGAMISD